MPEFLDLRDLAAFVAVADTGSFTQAARELATTQPAISARIAALEARVEARLVDRGARRSSLTPAGRELLPHARAMLRDNQSALRSIERFLGRPSGSVRVGASTAPASYLLPAALVEMRSAHPDISVELVVQDTSETIAALLDHDVEIAVVGREIGDERIETEPIGEDEVVLVACPALLTRLAIDHATARGLDELPLVMREPGSATRATVVGHLAQLGFSGFEDRIVLEVRANEAVREAALAGIGAAFLSRRAVHDAIATGRLVELDAMVPPLRRPLVLATRRGRTLSPAAECFTALLRRGS